MKRYRICVFGPAEGWSKHWSHLLERNASTEWSGYRGTFEVEAKNARAAGKLAIAMAKEKEPEVDCGG